MIHSILSGVTGTSWSSVTGSSVAGDMTGVFWNPQFLTLVESGQFATGLTRPVIWTKFRPVGTSGEGDFTYAAAHLKSGSTNSDKITRANEANALTGHLATLNSSAIILAGDFNWLGASEPAYLNFTASGLSDIANRPGEWRNNSLFKDLHTQSPGAALDDRFDMMLTSAGRAAEPAGCRRFPAPPSLLVHFPHLKLRSHLYPPLLEERQRLLMVAVNAALVAHDGGGGRSATIVGARVHRLIIHHERLVQDGKHQRVGFAVSLGDAPVRRIGHAPVERVLVHAAEKTAFTKDVAQPLEQPRKLMAVRGHHLGVLARVPSVRRLWWQRAHGDHHIRTAPQPRTERGPRLHQLDRLLEQLKRGFPLVDRVFTGGLR